MIAVGDAEHHGMDGEPAAPEGSLCCTATGTSSPSLPSPARHSSGTADRAGFGRWGRGGRTMVPLSVSPGPRGATVSAQRASSATLVTSVCTTSPKSSGRMTAKQRPLAANAMPKNSQNSLRPRLALLRPAASADGRRVVSSSLSSALCVMPPAWKPGPSVAHPAIVGCTPAKWLEPQYERTTHRLRPRTRTEASRPPGRSAVTGGAPRAALGRSSRHRRAVRCRPCRPWWGHPRSSGWR